MSTSVQVITLQALPIQWREAIRGQEVPLDREAGSSNLQVGEDDMPRLESDR